MTKNLADRNARMDGNDSRVAVPLYTFAEAARIADLPPRTVINLASPRRGAPMVEPFAPDSVAVRVCLSWPWPLRLS